MPGGDDFEDDFVPDELVALTDEEEAEGDDDSEEQQEENDSHAHTVDGNARNEGSDLVSRAPSDTAKKRKREREREKFKEKKKRKLLLEAPTRGSSAEGTTTTDQSPPALAEYLASLQKKAFSKLSALELEDARIPVDAIVDTSAWTGPRTLDNLVDFIVKVIPDLRIRLGQRSKTNGAPTLLFLATAALRVADVTRILRDKKLRGDKGGDVAKLFAKHFKLAQHVDYLRRNKIGAAAGTPGRIGQLLCETDSLAVSALTHIILDVSFRDTKKRNMFEIPEVRDERYIVRNPSAVIDRTATFVARSANPPQFEEKIREGQRSDPKFSFLNPVDPYHGYYRHKMDRVAQGDMGEEATQEKPETGATEDVAPIDMGVEPPAPDFVLELPTISSIDLDIMKLTALFTAKRGQTFSSALAVREGRNYQFEFLRPQHSLFGYFKRLVEQYQKVLYPNKEMLQQLKSRTEEDAKWKTLEVARTHAKWEKNKRERDKKRQDDAEAERIAFAEIDWHDYHIVQTIEFTAADSNAVLPPPMSVQEVENMTLTQKRMAAMIMENTADDIEAHRAKQAAAEAEAAAAVGNVGVGMDDDANMEESDDEDAEAERKQREAEEREREIERAKALQANTMNTSGPMKIRANYVPKLGSKNTKEAMTTCSICGQQIPVDELQEHMRIELLDPKWKEQRNALEARKAQAAELQSGANVVSALRGLARTRVDIFGEEADEERRKKEEEEQRERRKEREKVVWDGHTASKTNTLDKFSTNVNFDEQIAAIHRAKGLGPQEANAIGPGIGPAAVPPPLTGTLPPAPASLPAPPLAAGKAAGQYSAAATVSSGPQPASAYPAPVMLPPLHYQGMDAAQPFGYQPPAPAMHPTRAAALAAANGALQAAQAGTVRGAEEMEDSDDGIPPAKRQRVAKLPNGQLYSEQDWITSHPHPISLQVQLPKDDSKPEWKLDGSIVTIPDLPLNLLVSTLRDRIQLHTSGSVPVSRIRLSYSGKMLNNKDTIALYNLEDEDLVVLSVRDAKKK
ncbi:unnamed protein product [Mycena citricolor]|uniref:Pre-mRNA splicing factor n=1 Tax=Mycena citricolor TaxID=2018698 RepID=A0AAD2GXL4_9AGAR|nr:unnamed protein product [Mycena citricolor]CAK5279590.1 unnamed protein product [Mycena citricolor]